jgi:glycosyltransferase involved in cell wall biosynthesis
MTDLGAHDAGGRVSVVIPAFNAERTIEQAVRSALGQSHDNLEVIVVDDGSTDGTPRLLETIDDPRLTVLGQTNAGPAAARNAGIARATGAFVAFLDADDFWARDKLSAQLDALESNPAAGVAYSWTVFVDATGDYLFAKEPTTFAGAVLEPLLRENFLASASNALFTRACLRDVGSFSETIRWPSDWDHLLRAAERWPFALAPAYHVFYRFSPHAMSNHPTEIEPELHRVIESAAARRRNGSHGSIERASLANAELYLAFIELFRVNRAGWKRRARQWAWSALRLDRSILVRRKTVKLIIAVAVAQLLPARAARRAVRGLVRLHGRAMALRLPELRRALRSLDR